MSISFARTLFQLSRCEHFSHSDLQCIPGIPNLLSKPRGCPECYQKDRVRPSLLSADTAYSFVHVSSKAVPYVNRSRKSLEARKSCQWGNMSRMGIIPCEVACGKNRSLFRDHTTHPLHMQPPPPKEISPKSPPPLSPSVTDPPLSPSVTDPPLSPSVTDPPLSPSVTPYARARTHMVEGVRSVAVAVTRAPTRAHTLQGVTLPACALNTRARPHAYIHVKFQNANAPPADVSATASGSTSHPPGS